MPWAIWAWELPSKPDVVILHVVVWTKRCRLKRLDYSMTGESRLGKTKQKGLDYSIVNITPCPQKGQKKTWPIFLIYRNLIEGNKARRLRLRTASGSDWKPPSWRSTDIQGRIWYAGVRRTQKREPNGIHGVHTYKICGRKTPPAHC